jgi:hypothetical protein
MAHPLRLRKMCRFELMIDSYVFFAAFYDVKTDPIKVYSSYYQISEYF